MKNFTVDSTGGKYAYWEVFRYGQDGDIFEIVETPVNRFKGTRVVLKGSGDIVVMKEIGTYHNEDSSTLVTPYGGITGAIFKRVSEYSPISYMEALEALANDKQVYVKSNHNHTSFDAISIHTDLSDILIDDFLDLIKTNFYMKK